MPTADLAYPPTAPRLRSDELLGLAVAVAAHVAIVVALALDALRQPAVIAPPERVEVSLAEDVGLTSEAQQVSQEAQAAVSPTLGEKPAPPPEPKAQPQPAPKRNTPVVDPRTSSQQAQRKPPAKVEPKAGTSRLGPDFLKGKSDGNSDADAPIPASQIGASDKASLKQAIDRQLKPYWQPPSGADADELRTYLAFDLNPDGSLAGAPRLVSQSGVTDANKTQASRHAELAIRAVRRAAPFDLPPKFYNAWKHITNWEFKWTPQ